MQIFINKIPAECPDGSKLSEILLQQGIQPLNIAVAVNDIVIPKAQWDTTVVADNSNLIIIKAVQGG